MQRVTRSTAISTLPSPPSAPGTPGYFTGGDPVTATPATVPGFEWFNGVQEELAGLVLRSGLTLDAADVAQVRKSLDRLYGGGRLAVTANTTLTADDAGLVLVSAAGGAVTLTLPAANAAAGRPIQFEIVRADTTSANAVTVQRAGSDTIETVTVWPITVGDRVRLVSDGVDSWAILAEARAGRAVTENGWVRQPGGLLLQWGRVSRASRTISARTTVTFPIAFPTACFVVIPSIDFDNAGWLDMHAGADTPSTTQVVLYAGTQLAAGEGAESRTFGWHYIAIGN